MADTVQRTTRKQTTSTTATPTTSPTPLKTVTVSKPPEEKKPENESDIELEIATKQAELKKRQFYLLLSYIWNMANIVIVSLLVYWGIQSRGYGDYLFIGGFLWVGMVFSVVEGVAIVIVGHLERTDLKTEIDVLNAKKRVAKQLATDAKTYTNQGEEVKISGQTPPVYFDSLVKLNVENLEAYYRLVRHHTDKSFMVSIVVGIIGLSLIVAGLLIGFLDLTKTPTLSYIASASGILTDFIAGVFFYLYNRTVRQMKDYHDSLLSVQNVLLAFKIIGETQDETNKTEMVNRLITYLIERQEIPTASIANARQGNGGL